MQICACLSRKLVFIRGPRTVHTTPDNTVRAGILFSFFFFCLQKLLLELCDVAYSICLKCVPEIYKASLNICLITGYFTRSKPASSKVKLKNN